MSIKKALFLNGKEFLNHAYLLTGSGDYWSQTLSIELKKFFQTDNLSSCPDLWWQRYDSFGIKEAHDLIRREVRRSFGRQGRVFVIEILAITSEAQNALLKTFEEPASGAHFFVIARNVEMFLPTLRSRMVVLCSEVGQNEVGSRATRSNFVNAERFLKLDFPDRLDFIQKEFLKSKDKSKSEIIDFIEKLEKVFHAKIELRKITKDEELILHELEKCQHYLINPRSSNRLILEHLALILPILE